MDKNGRGIIEVLIALAVAIWLMSRCHEETPVFKVERDTVTVVKKDTVAKVLPVHDTAYIVRFVKIPVTTTDTVEVRDSVELPVEQKVYKDSDYVAWVSGVMPQLDSLNIFRRTETVTITETITRREKAPRWSVGLQGGYGYGIKSKELEPFLGVGVTYKIFPLHYK